MAFKSKWSEDVKRGVLCAVFDHGLSARRAHELAVTGELPQTTPGKPRAAAAPGLPCGTVQDWARHERARRGVVAAAQAAPSVVLAQTVARMVAVHLREVKRAERLSARGQLARGELGKLARDAVEIEKLARATSRDAPPAAPNSARSNGVNGSGEAGETTGSWLDGLAADA